MTIKKTNKVIGLAGGYLVYKFTPHEKKDMGISFNYAVRKSNYIKGFKTLKDLNKATNFYGIKRFSNKTWRDLK